MFSRNPEAFNPVSIDGNEIEVVNSAKFIGITISDNLTRNAHVDEVVKKASKKLYFLVQLKRARLPPSDLILFYLSCVRSAVDYGVPALSIILPSMGYNKACEVLGITPITEHHSQLCGKLFDAIVTDPNHKLHGLLPQKNNASNNFRNNRPFVLPRDHTNRSNNTFILAMP